MTGLLGVKGKRKKTIVAEREGRAAPTGSGQAPSAEAETEGERKEERT